MKQRTEDKFKSGIYVIQNNINQKKYVGKAKNIYLRIKQHVTALNTKNKDENPHLINSWHKYGRENFSYYVVEYLYDEDINILEKLLAERELYWMKTLDSLNREKGYNLRYDSEGKCFVQDETREKCRQAQLTRYKDPKEHEIMSEILKKKRAEHPELWEDSKIKLAYINRQYRIAKCDKLTGEIIKIYEIIKDISDENPDYYLQAIKGCCQGTKNSYKGFRWHYCDLNEEKLILKGKFKLD